MLILFMVYKVASVVAGLVAALAISIGVKSSNDSEASDTTVGPNPQFTVLALEDGFDTNYPVIDDLDETTVGRKHGWYLTGTNSNEEWWNWSYKKLKLDISKEDNFHPEFKAVKSPYASKDSINSESNYALNKICEKFLKKKTFDLDIGKFEDIYLIAYCSPLNQTPLAIFFTFETTYDDKPDSLGKKIPNTLISTAYPQNDLFWTLRNSEFLNGHLSRDISQNKNLANSPIKALFLENNSEIKDSCSKAYLLNANSEEEELVKHFCSWETVN